MVRLLVNGRTHDLPDLDPTMPVLWVLRDHLGLTGTKYGCGKALCGACTIHVEGRATRSCQLAAGDAQGLALTTIEGLSPDGSHPLQKAWVEKCVSQCGYCQPGQIMSAAALLATDPHPDEPAIARALDGNLCRCGTYQRIRDAVKAAAGGGA